MISVVIPLYNKEKDISLTINSVLCQTFKEFELLVVDDGSNDGSKDVVERIDDARIKLISKENGGVCSARNMGILHANNEWIAFLDGDDIWDRDHLSHLVRAIGEFPENLFFGTDLKSENLLSSFYNAFIVDDFYETYLKSGAIVHSSTCLIHKSVFETVGYFNENLVRGEDIEMWDRIAQHFKFVKIAVQTVKYKLDASNRAMNKSVPLQKCFVEMIPVKALQKKTSRAKFLRYHVILKLRSTLFKKEIVDFIKILLKYNYHLLK